MKPVSVLAASVQSGNLERARRIAQALDTGMVHVNDQTIRDKEGANLMEVLFVTGVSSVLLIRAFLSLTGYPKLSPRSLHIAHALLGGPFMLADLIVLLAFVNPSARYMAANLGGFGFGAFIDEVGKFLTGDNNYFFQPAVAIIYITFVRLYQGIQYINHIPWLSEEARLVNALEPDRGRLFSPRHGRGRVAEGHVAAG